MSNKIPRDPQNDYTREMAEVRQRFVGEKCGHTPHHLNHYSFDPAVLPGNIEHFSGVAQVPIGFAGPLLVNGEYAQGEFFVPLATTEGTLVASYNRGMKALHASGGIKTTICSDAMQRAPVFIFKDARDARDFGNWIKQEDTLAKMRELAESTTSIGKLLNIEHYIANKFLYLRFNYYTGDAAGQNMVGKATFLVCEWIKQERPEVLHYYLESNFATDKKGSQINVIRTRGKRVTAEATIPRAVLENLMHTSVEPLHYHHQIANIGGFISHVNNNGAHSANGITAIFIATGQDVANVAESSAGILFAEKTPNDELYLSITIPSLIVGTYGGGTGLATQRECLEILGCYGTGKVKKFAEIVAATVLAGELSLASAISGLDWVSSHDKYGRNRP
ncbi:MAG: hydroxymethylglutaryl-CoA reductase [Candidatus Hydrogenedens sp.]|nr:hydroxymethylglutaryl-CoA reductase [Candidatus Hydrogenedens sp.]